MDCVREVLDTYYIIIGSSVRCQLCVIVSVIIFLYNCFIFPYLENILKISSLSSSKGKLRAFIVLRGQIMGTRHGGAQKHTDTFKKKIRLRGTE